MNKKAAENIAKALPAFFKNAANYLKTNFEDHGKEIFDGASGTAVVITKFFAQPLIDKYFRNLTAGKNTFRKSKRNLSCGKLCQRRANKRK